VAWRGFAIAMRVSATESPFTDVPTGTLASLRPGSTRSTIAANSISVVDAWTTWPDAAGTTADTMHSPQPYSRSWEGQVWL